MIEHVTGLTAVAAAGVAMATSETGGGYVEYGALGLCAFMVYFLCNHLTLKEKNHSEERQATAKYMNRLAVMLGNRPCLMDEREELDPENTK
jgi:hypothetical protein